MTSSPLIELVAPRVGVLHRDTRIFNVCRPLAAPSQLDKNIRAIVNFTVDVLARRRSEGFSSALLMRKDAEGGRAYMSEFIKAFEMEVAHRGMAPFSILRPGEPIPSKPSPSEVGVVTYGMTGLGCYEHFQTLVAVHAYHVSPDAIRDAAFDDLPPSKRPLLSMKKGDVRKLDFGSGPLLSEEMQQRANLTMFRMEVDVTAQAVHRVRPALHPRLIVLNMRTDPRMVFGRAVQVKNLSEARVHLQLPESTSASRRESQAKALGDLVSRGVTITDAAEQLGISRSTASSLRKDFGGTWEVPKGRPPSS